MKNVICSLSFVSGCLLLIASSTSSFLEKTEYDAISDWEMVDAIQTSLKNYESLRGTLKSDAACYEHVGCFFSEDTVAPGTLPYSPEKIHTQFFLYTPKNPTYPEKLSYTEAEDVKDTSFDLSRPTKFIIHGFASHANKAWVRNMKDTLLEMEDMNIITVEWKQGASFPFYVEACVNTELVARQIAHWIKHMVKYNGLDIQTVHIIGFSLGGHLAGFIGETLKKEFMKVERITGLDPAGPLFCVGDVDARLHLDPSDAKFVDVIHTNADYLVVGGAGCNKDLGHVDFYPNGGKKQPGCPNFFWGSITDMFSENEEKLCNHRRACQLFIESIKSPCQFSAFKCPGLHNFDDDFLTGDCFDWNTHTTGQLGYHSNKAAGRGALYLVTGSKPPLCTTQVQTKLRVSYEPLVTYADLQLSFSLDGQNFTLPLTMKKDAKIHVNTTVSYVVAVEEQPLDVSSIPPIDATLTYTPYNGWIWDGSDDFYFDSVTLTDNHGNSRYYCGVHTHVHSEEFMPASVTIQLQATPCSSASG